MSPPSTIFRLFYCRKYIIIVQGLTLFSVIGFKFGDPDVWVTSCVWLYISSFRSRSPTYFENEGFPWATFTLTLQLLVTIESWLYFFRFRQLFFLEEYLKTCFFLKRAKIMFTFFEVLRKKERLNNTPKVARKIRYCDFLTVV